MVNDCQGGPILPQDAIKRRFNGVLLRLLGNCSYYPVAEKKVKYVGKGKEPTGLFVHICLYCLSLFVIPSAQERSLPHPFPVKTT